MVTAVVESVVGDILARYQVRAACAGACEHHISICMIFRVGLSNIDLPMQY